jgi:hypothetical protein
MLQHLSTDDRPMENFSSDVRALVGSEKERKKNMKVKKKKRKKLKALPLPYTARK